MDLISGRYNINRNGPSPFQLNGFETLSVSTMSFVFVFPLLFCFFNEKSCQEVPQGVILSLGVW